MLQDLPVVLSMRAVDHKGIRFPAADDPSGIFDDLPDLLADTAEHIITIGCAEPFIDHMKMIDIHHDGIHFHILMMLIETLCIAIEILPVIQFG